MHSDASAPTHRSTGSRLWRSLPPPLQRGLKAAPVIGPLLQAHGLVPELQAQVGALHAQAAALVAQLTAAAEQSQHACGESQRQLQEQQHRLEALTRELTVGQNMQVWRSIADNPERRAVSALECFGQKGYSQNDEDGILIEIFRRIGIAHRTFVEVGVGNGLENNTALWLKQGWRGAWFEGNPQHLRFIRDHFAPDIAAKRLTAFEAIITKENCSALIADAGFKGEIDLLSIDVDGNDYYIFEQLRGLAPRVVVIEYNAKFPPPLRWVIPYDPGFCWDGSDWFGASLEAMNDVFRKKGYCLVGCNVTGANAFFVRDDLVVNRFYRPGEVAVHYQPARYFLTTGLFAYLGGHPASARSGLNPAAG